jgi:hypothetical protein
MENSLSFPHSDTTNNNNNVLSLLKKPSTFFRTSHRANRDERRANSGKILSPFFKFYFVLTESPDTVGTPAKMRIKLYKKDSRRRCGKAYNKQKDPDHFRVFLL